MQYRHIYARVGDEALVHRVIVRLELLRDLELLEGRTLEPLVSSRHSATLRWDCSYCFTSAGSPVIFGARLLEGERGLSAPPDEFERRGGEVTTI